MIKYLRNIGLAALLALTSVAVPAVDSVSTSASAAVGTTYQDGLRDSLAIVKMVRGQYGGNVALDVVQLELESKLAPAAPAFVPGTPMPSFQMTDGDWVLTKAAVEKANNPTLRIVAQYNMRWMPQSIRDRGLVDFHPVIMSNPHHIMHIMSADIAAKLGVSPELIKRVQ